MLVFFFSSRRRHTRLVSDWSSDVCSSDLHTHDTAGTIHVESRVTREYTLGEFFQIWGQTFDGQQVLGHVAQQGHRVRMVVNGAEVSPSYSLVLRDGMHIELVCGPQ